MPYDVRTTPLPTPTTFIEPDLWLDEESTDNPSFQTPFPTPDLTAAEIHAFCLGFDPVLQFRNLRKVRHLFDDTSQHKHIIRRANVATVELTDFELSPTAQIYTATTDELPIVIDTGASVTLTPNPNDFIGPIRPSNKTKVNGLSSSTTVAGIGTVQWLIRDALGIVRQIKTEAYYVPEASIRLFSPQKYLMEQQKGHLFADKDVVSIEIEDGTRLRFPYQRGSCLPIMLTNKHFTDHDNISGLTFSDVSTMQALEEGSGLLNAADEMNQNLTGAQKELKLLHDRLGHCDMQRIQELSVDRTAQGEPRILTPQQNSAHVPCL